MYFPLQFIASLLLQTALQPLWFMACSTIVEYSQQEGFYRVLLPAARQTPNLEDQWLERSISRHQVKWRERTPVAEGETMGEKFPRILPRLATSTSLLHAVNLRHGTDGFTSPPKEGALRMFSPEKSDGFDRVWTRELGYQRLVRLPLDHRSRSSPSSAEVKNRVELYLYSP